MVFFCCNSCGSSLKKNAVDKHFMQCRSASVSCMDCHKDFKGNDYQGHTKCISEQEKYGGPGYKAAENQNKGEKKQMAWYETVQATLIKAGQSLRPAAKNLLQNLTKHENVPRKKPKFFNFVANVGRNKFDQDTVLVVWDLLESQWKSENDKTVGPKTSQGEEKKETEATSSAEGETPAISDKTDNSGQKENKKKKKKDKKGKDDVEQLLEAEADSSTMIIEESVETEKKKKKRKRGETEETVSTEPLTEVTVTAEPAEEPPKKKKKRKNKNKDGENLTELHGNGHTEHDVNGNGNVLPDEEGELVIALNGEEDGTKKSKKKKKNKDKEAATNSLEQNGKYARLQQSMTEDENNSMILNEDSSVNKKKKNKKNKHQLLA